MSDVKNGNTLIDHVWVTHHDIYEDYPYLDNVSEYPWEADYDAPVTKTHDNTKYRRADLPPTPEQIMADPRVKALVERVEQLNAACDAMWNDHDRIEKCRDIIRGVPYAIKEKHMRAICEAQQRLPAAIAQLKEPKP